MGGARTEGAGAALGKLALVADGLAAADEEADGVLAALAEILALEAFLAAEAGIDLADLGVSEVREPSALASLLWFALTAAIVALGCKMAFAALEALLDLDDLEEELFDGMTILGEVSAKLV